MDFVKQIPDTPEIIKCDRHGESEATYLQSIDKFLVQNSCRKCDEEKHKIQVAENIKQENILNAQRKERLRLKAGISKRNLNKTFPDFFCKNKNQAKAFSACEKFVNNFPKSNNLILSGSVGTGKTLIASIVVDSLIDRHSCQISKLIDIVRELKATWGRLSDTTESELIKHYSELSLLVVDEVGMQFSTDTEKLFINDIIDGRYQNMLPTILISNLDADGVGEAIGERCLDRLREDGGQVVAFDWESQRTIKKEVKTEESKASERENAKIAGYKATGMMG